ncbi:MAG: oxygen-dependent coproporphyrinogen oxidase [Acidimicrobiia bacterium]|nr:oxygen-dependent coproporphyrinogen oxidase [Acidimicrobiia bacterium]
MDRSDIETGYRTIQELVCAGLSGVDGTAQFRHDQWDRPDGGGGVTRILVGGPIEKAAVNFSAVWGETPAELSEFLAAASHNFYATGVSIIVHPRNPQAPTFHANLRYLETDTGSRWFGGGCDLTPYYLYEEDARHFHTVLKEVCDRHPVADYPGWKQACDRYFFLPHRGEARGIGGLFFDHLTERSEEVWAFCTDLGGNLLRAYLPILQRRLNEPYDDSQEAWHELRRGRYVEFNLVWDRGTRFGLDTGGRTESILASLPPRARWEYGAEPPPPGTAEARLLELVRGAPRDWA